MTEFLFCELCGKQVSTGFISIEIPHVIIIASIRCPTCVEKEDKEFYEEYLLKETMLRRDK